MSKRLNRQIVAMVMATSMASGIIPVQAAQAVVENKQVAMQTEGVFPNLLHNAGFEETMPLTNTTDQKFWKGAVGPVRWAGLWVPTAGAGLELSLDETTKTEGKQAIKVTAPAKSRVCFGDTIEIDSAKTYKFSMDIKTDNVVGTGAYFRVQYLDKDNKKVEPMLSISGINGTKDWKNYQITLENIPSNAVKAKIEVFFENATGAAWYDNAMLKETYDFSLNRGRVKVMPGETVELEAIFGMDIPDKTIQWTSNNEKVATVDTNGLVSTHVPGEAIVTATTVDGNTATCTIVVKDAVLEAEYQVLRGRYADKQTVNNITDVTNPDYIASMETLAERAQGIWDTMIKYNPETDGVDTRKDLWAKYNTAGESSHVTSTVRDLRTLTAAYTSKGCSFYQNEELGKDILLGLQWLYDNRYNEHVKLYKNWWDWTIGAPQSLNEMLVMIYDELPQDLLDGFMRAVSYFVPNPYYVLGGPNPLSSANLLDTALVCVGSGILEGADARIKEAVEAISDIFPYVTKGNGFYEDGSYIDHSVIPYAGGYGGSLMSSLSNILFLTDGSTWEVTDPQLDNAYDWIINSFEPVYYKGAIMDIVNGRGVSRGTSSDHHKGKGLMLKMLALSETAPEPKKTQIQSFIKENIVEDTMCEDFFKGLNLNDTLAVKELLANPAIPARGDLELNKVYGAMDRTVHHRPGFSLALSMFSTRIGAYEVGNGENLKPWHTADGMMYLYNDDHTQFTKDFWPTVDPMRLPGITTDHSTRLVKDWYGYHSSKDWVGGSSLYDKYGATGMEFEMEPGKSTLTGKKSWFMFDDEVVCLGAGINASDDTLVETMVENRKIKDSGDNTILVDGIETAPGFEETNLADAKWAHLSGNTEAGTDTLGYYFPESNPLKVRREARTGSWKEINTGYSDAPITKNYISLAIEHGNNPVDETYSYVLLPNKSVEEVAQYSQSSDMTILANTKDVQAVRESKLGVTGFNFWNPATVEAVTAENPCSVMLGQKEDLVDISLSDPTHKQSRISIVLQGDYYVVDKDDAVSVEYVEGGIRIIANTQGALGSAKKIQLKGGQRELVAETIKINGKELPKFNPNNNKYDVKLPYGTTVMPKVEATSTHKVNIIMPESLPGQAVIEIISKTDETQKDCYYINFTVETEWLKVSSQQTGNEGKNTVDGVEGTRWAAEGTDEWIQYYVGEDKALEELKIKFFYPAGNTTRRYNYSIAVSEDEENWTTIYVDQVSNGAGEGFITYTLDTPVAANFVRINANGSNESKWNNIDEVEMRLGDREVVQDQATSTLEGPQKVEENTEFKMTLGVDRAQDIYAQDITLQYNAQLFELLGVEGLGQTQVVGKEEKIPGTIRILAATEKGAIGRQDLLALNFKSKEVAATQTGEMSITQMLLGHVANDEVTTSSAITVGKQVEVTDKPIIIETPEDVNKDGKVDVADLALIAFYYQADLAANEAARSADVNKDGEVDITDLSIVASKILEK